jgi:hypothetical protein
VLISPLILPWSSFRSLVLLFSHRRSFRAAARPEDNTVDRRLPLTLPSPSSYTTGSRSFLCECPVTPHLTLPLPRPCESQRAPSLTSSIPLHRVIRFKTSIKPITADTPTPVCPCLTELREVPPGEPLRSPAGTDLGSPARPN